MQKKIIALAIAAAISAPAFADTSNVTVYGLVDASYDSIRTGSSTTVNAPAGVTSNRVSSNSSRIGLKGSEDLGSGLSAIWQVESLVNIGNGGSAGTGIGSRDTFAGLSSVDAGTVLLGRHDTPYKMATRAYDVFGDGIADNRSIMGGNTGPTQNAAGFNTARASFDGRQDQVVAYVSPKIGGMFTIAAAYVNLNPAYANVNQAKSKASSVAGMFDIGGGLNASVAYEEHDLGGVAAVAAVAPSTYSFGSPAVAATGNTKEKATKLGLGYAQDMFAVNAVYEKTKDDMGTNGADLMGHKAYYLSGKFFVTPSDAIKAAYTKAGDTSAANSGAKQFSLGYDHMMSKRTTVYALYTKIRNESGAGYALANTSSVGGNTTTAGVGASPSAFAVGMRHSF